MNDTGLRSSAIHRQFMVSRERDTKQHVRTTGWRDADWEVSRDLKCLRHVLGCLFKTRCPSTGAYSPSAARITLSSDDHLALFGQITYTTINRPHIPDICTHGEHAVAKSTSQNRSPGHTTPLVATRSRTFRSDLASFTTPDSAFINVLCLARNPALVDLYRIHICTLSEATYSPRPISFLSILTDEAQRC